jgi:anti-anti-sigma factor
MARNTPPSPVVSDCSVSFDDEGRIVYLRGEHDLATVDPLSSALARLITGRASLDLRIDLSDVCFMDASTLGVIVRARQLIRGSGVTLEVGALSPCARRLFDISGLGHLVDPLTNRCAPPPLGGEPGEWNASAIVGRSPISPGRNGAVAAVASAGPR